MNGVKQGNMKPDIYFDDNFGKLYEDIEYGKSEVFRFSSSEGAISTQFIKRAIPMNINGCTYYDLITPYGYGGPYIVESTANDKSVLVTKFMDEFKQYCMDNHIVSEFIRFHPIIGNHKDFINVYDTVYLHPTVGTKIEGIEDPIQEEFSKSCRKSIRRALKSGIDYKVIENPENIDEFLKIYYSTMDRNHASTYYYFDKSYFDKCLKYYRKNIILVEAIYKNNIIAAGFYFYYNRILQAHLSGTLSEYLHLSPAYIIKYATARWAKEHGMSYIHYGGGTSNSLEDPLYLFKKKFTKNTEFEYWIGKKIWNSEVYEELCKQKAVEETDYFPAYRK